MSFSSKKGSFLFKPSGAFTPLDKVYTYYLISLELCIMNSDLNETFNLLIGSQLNHPTYQLPWPSPYCTWTALWSPSTALILDIFFFSKFLSMSAEKAKICCCLCWKSKDICFWKKSKVASAGCRGRDFAFSCYNCSRLIGNPAWLCARMYMFDCLRFKLNIQVLRINAQSQCVWFQQDRGKASEGYVGAGWEQLYFGGLSEGQD